jgi:hypothetical protein
MKNRLFAFMTVFVVAFGLAACDRGTTTTTTPTTTPTTTAPATTDPAATGPATTDPAATTPATTDPAATAPAATDPVTTAPATTDPVATTPATTPDTEVTTVEGDADAVAGAETGGAMTAELEQAHQEAAQELQSLDFQAESEEAVQDAQVAVATARQNLENAYQEAGEAASAQWQELQAEFDRVEQALADGATNALQEVETLLNRIQDGLN